MIHHRFSHSGGCCYISVNLPHVWVWIWKIVCMNLLQKINLVFQYSMIFFIHWRSGLNKTCNNVSFKHDENWYILTSKLTHISLPTWLTIQSIIMIRNKIVVTRRRQTTILTISRDVQMCKFDSRVQKMSQHTLK